MAGRVFVTGDCHTEFDRFKTRIFTEQKELDKEDYMIICGDAGICWDGSKEEAYWQRWLEEKPFTTLFVDGNHENFDLLSSYPVEEWHGGKVHKIMPSVIHLMRGQIYEIAGKTWFTFGGASSHDVEGGILDSEDKNLKLKIRRLKREGLCYRINGLNWWKEELPVEEELEEARRNLEKAQWEVDFIVTHCCSTSTQRELSDGSYKEDILTDFFDEIKEKCRFRKWFFGHYHDNKNIGSREILIEEQIIEIPL